MQNGKSGSYVWARAGPAAETDTIAKIAKATRRIGIIPTIDGTASAHANRPVMLIPVNSRSRAGASRVTIIHALMESRHTLKFRKTPRLRGGAVLISLCDALESAGHQPRRPAARATDQFVTIFPGQSGAAFAREAVARSGSGPQARR